VREREKEREGRGETEQSVSGTLHPDFIVKSITRNGAMSESRVHPVISRYFFVREVTRLRENLARILCLSFSLPRVKRANREEGRHKKRSPFEDISVEVVATRWCATTTSSKRKRGRSYTMRRNLAVTHGRIELFIVMAACSTASSLCVGVRGRRGDLCFSRTLFPSLAASLPCPPCPALSVEYFDIYKYRYQTLSLSWCYNIATRAKEPLYSILFLTRAVPPLLRSLSRPFCSVCMQRAAHSRYTPLGVQHLPTWPRHNCIRPADPVHDRRQHLRRQHLRCRRRHRRAAVTRAALNLSPRTTLLHYPERLIRNYYLDRTLWRR